MSHQHDFCVQGGCVCGNLRFVLTDEPLFVQCCHCPRCRKLSGSVYGAHAIIESSKIQLLKGRPQPVRIPSNDHAGEKICCCPVCKTLLWVHLLEFGDAVSYVNLGTLDEPQAFPPAFHLHIKAKLPWVDLPQEIAHSAGDYDRQVVWPAESLKRLEALGSTFPDKWLKKILGPKPPKGTGPDLAD